MSQRPRVVSRQRRNRLMVSALATLAVTATAGPVVVPAITATAAPAAAAAEQAEVSYWNGVNPVTELTGSTFANPPANDKAWVRWNWPPATTTDEQLLADLQDMAEANIAGVEIGQGGNPTNEQLSLILDKANELDITVGIKYSGGAPTTGTWVNTHDYTRKTLTNSRTLVNAGETFTGALPGSGTIVAVIAYRCASATCETTGPRVVERGSAINLTASITDKNTDGFFDGTTAGNLSWTAPASPAGAQWQLVTFRTSAFQNAPETLTKQGTQAMIDGYEALWTPELKAKLEANRSDIFVDSHPTDPWGNATELWSSTMATDFQSRAGYNLVPDLAALFYNDFRYSNGRDQRVRSDFYQVRNDLFIENRIKPFTAWANTHGMTLRLQPEDPNIGGADVPFQDQIDVSYNLQRVEHESLVGDQIDIWRPIASANSWTGNPWYSKECCAVGGQNYVETMQDIQARMNKAFAAGITKNVYHVYPTGYSPTSTYPGYANFGPTSFSGSWGPRNPNWATDGAEVNTWMARNQQVLTQGRSDIDVAVYLHSFEWPAGALVNTDGTPFRNRFWEDQAMQRAGYSWDYVNPTLLASKDAKVTGGVLNAAGPSYKVLVVNTGLQTPWHPLKSAMPVATAKRMLELAEDGMKILLVGDAPSTTPGDNGDDAELRAVFADLLEQPTVRRVASEAGVPAKLAGWGVQPDMKPSERSTLFSRHLKDRTAGTDYYFLYNQGEERLDWASRDMVYEEPEACRYTGTSTPCRQKGEAVHLDVTLTGEGAPYLLDADSGEITPISEYTVGDGTVTVDVALGRDESTIVALTNDPTRFGVEALERHVVSTTADEAVVTAGKVILRDTEPGTYSATLSDGSTVSATIGAVAPVADLTDDTWKLSAEKWTNANPIGTTGAAGAAIAKNVVDVTLDGLKAWPDVPELVGASGVGTYRVDVEMPASWQQGGSAVLSLGQVVDTMALTVNGSTVPINTLSAKADIGEHLKPGSNTVEVRVATTLNNQLASVLPAVATRGVTQEYGIVGPVTLTPAGQAEATAPGTGPGAPASIAAPSISGAAKVGSTVRCESGTWTNATSFAYSWTANGTAIAGAGRQTLALDATTVGKAVTCTVTATGPGGDTTATSAPVEVAKGDALTATSKPRLVGKARVGSRLKARHGQWTPQAASYAYTWKANGKVIKGATGKTYKLEAKDRRKKITVTVTATLTGYADGKATSAARKVTGR
ncbi:glycosyl hydrolase [Nocardioides xinjiangensis]|uniref:glycosyl hydrolase n=1 Tax=Nocardioides xinjiangensis TaxID=2817376 RepID=UPI001B3040F4|nr:glycosyl hydrolase [Nocardioides sp. SYSU D00514]